MMTVDRWRMNRAGVVNFWYYDEEEFEVSEGRLILRGPNGSGKSVTMQSFLPLVLDGDKRPVRLDPFGSRDRKIEYYLLGETDSGMTDRTGYLYLEFKNPATQKYLTVGIGLRARRGAQQVGFWGFAVTDQRRIGRDIFLYREDFGDAAGTKVPLDRAGLEAVIGDGGRVVRAQEEYRALVNQLLFGFVDEEAYKDLLSLLIQLRSPKLSKDHKPSVIYGILNDALPALADDDLRPLSEILEDLDEITGRLEELARHRGDAERLHAVYDQYNQLLLYVLSVRLVDNHRAVSELENQVAERERAWEEIQRRTAELEQGIEEARQGQSQTETQIELINLSEAMEKQREFENANDRLAEVGREIEAAVARRDEDAASLRGRLNDIEVAKTEADRHDQDALQYLGQLKELAEMAEFSDHAVYEGIWGDRQGRTEPAQWQALQRDVANYEVALKAGRELGRQVLRRQEQAEAAEAALSLARETRDERERAFQSRQQEMEAALTDQEDAILLWQRGLRTLPVADDYWRESLRRLQKYPGVSYMQVADPIRAALSAAEAGVERERAEVRHALRQARSDRDRLMQELEGWLKKREPEPDRSEARVRARTRRQAAMQEKPAGGPLYSLCEFRPHVDDSTRAAIETSLHQSGLLDAWVSPDLENPHSGAGVVFAADEEEVWLKPNPAWLVETLAEYLEPTPSADSGLTFQQVDDVLRTIVFGEWSAGPSAGFDKQALVAGNGSFQIGPLRGQTAVKPAAEWIGAEARKRTRLAHIGRLQAEIREQEGVIERREEELRQLDARQAGMKAEFGDFPTEEPLRAAGDALRHARLDLSHSLELEEKANEEFKRTQRVWRELQQQFVSLTAKWTSLRSVEDLEEALERMRQYGFLSRDLKAAFAASAKAVRDADRLTGEIARLKDRVAREDESLREGRERRQHWKTTADTLKRLLNELGVGDLVEQLQSLRRERDEWKRKGEQMSAELGDVREARGERSSLLDESRRRLSAAESQLQSALTRLQAEWQLGLVDAQAVLDMDSASFSRPAALVKAAQSLARQWRNRYESRKLENLASQLLDAVSMAYSGLREYALEHRYDEALDRWTVASLRDRGRPLTPGGLLRQLQQMEEEQRALISEKDRELYEQILLHSVGNAIRDKINRAERWVDEMNQFMAARKTSSGLLLSLEWAPRAAKNEGELDTDKLVSLLRKSPDTLRQGEIDEMMAHFRSRITWAKEMAEDGTTLRQNITTLLDYRSWFGFTLYLKKGEATRRELTDARFNVLSGGEKAMAMYIPLFAATDSRYKGSRKTSPRIISLDEAFAGVDEQNMGDMFQLLTDMGFDYMMTSQVLWGCYETVPALSIYEVHRQNDADFVTLIPYYWNGVARTLVADGDWDAAREIAAGKA